jgi:hypothetical protein
MRKGGVIVVGYYEGGRDVGHTRTYLIVKKVSIEKKNTYQLEGLETQAHLGPHLSESSLGSGGRVWTRRVGRKKNPYAQTTVNRKPSFRPSSCALRRIRGLLGKKRIEPNLKNHVRCFK